MVLGLVMVWLIPPFQKADEIIHLQNVSSMFSGQNWSIQKRFLSLPEKLKGVDISHRYERKFEDSRLWEKDFDKALVTFGYNTNVKSFITYFPAEIGVWIGSLFPYPVMALYLGRMAGLILFLICIWVALKIIDKKYAGLVMAYAMIPMVVHQVTEVSYDVFLLCLAPLILAVFVKTLRQAQGNNWKLLISLIALTALFVMVKPGYYPMVLLVVIVLWQKYKLYLIKKPWIIGLFVLLSVPIVLKFVGFLDSNANWSGNQVEILRRDPVIVFRIVVDTWEAKRDFYLQGMMGYFGWLDYQYEFGQFLVIFGLIVSIITSVISKNKKAVVDWLGWVIIGGIVFGTYLLIEMGMWMQWTAVGSTVVEGVQGRYLLPLVPLFLFWIVQFWLLVGKKRANIIALGLGLLIVGLGTVDKINKRYYDNSSNFANKDEYKKNIEEPKYISSKDKLTKYFHTSETDVVGGFEFVVNKNNNDNLIKVPYRYAIKDGECNKELSWGYLDVDKINKGNIYLQKIDYLKPGFADICFEIEPIVKKETEKYFDFVESNDEVLLRLLFVSNEIK